ncbi:ZN112 protein, partial [Chloropsis cyanopogon]|nr:ZN112 protein [Chloropsis cyanopogon]
CQKGDWRSNQILELVEKPYAREKPHGCLESGKGFRWSFKLRKHQNIHPGYWP